MLSNSHVTVRGSPHVLSGTVAVARGLRQSRKLLNATLFGCGVRFGASNRVTDAAIGDAIESPLVTPGLDIEA
jgi:hypothetical protein